MAIQNQKLFLFRSPFDQVLIGFDVISRRNFLSRPQNSKNVLTFGFFIYCFVNVRDFRILFSVHCPEETKTIQHFLYVFFWYYMEKSAFQTINNSNLAQLRRKGCEIVDVWVVNVNPYVLADCSTFSNIQLHRW